jgi:hypothetical protein
MQDVNSTLPEDQEQGCAPHEEGTAAVLPVAADIRASPSKKTYPNSQICEGGKYLLCFWRVDTDINLQSGSLWWEWMMIRCGAHSVPTPTLPGKTSSIERMNTLKSHVMKCTLDIVSVAMGAWCPISQASPTGRQCWLVKEKVLAAWMCAMTMEIKDMVSGFLDNRKYYLQF